MPDETESKGSSTQPQGKSSGRRKGLLIGFTGLILALGFIYLLYYFTVGRHYISTDDAYVRGNLVQFMPRVSGTVTVIGAEQTQLVKQGQPLVKLDETDFQIAFERAKANLAITVRQVQSLFEAARQQQASVKLQQAQLKLAQKNYYRAKKLIVKNLVSQQRLDDSLTNLQVAQDSLALAQHQLSGSEAIIAGTTVKDHPQVKLAGAQLQEAYLALKRTRILAPVTGFVAKRAVQVGQEVNPGMAMMAIVPLRQVWIEANFKETSLAGVRIGQPVTLTADFYGSDVTYHGKVAGLSAGTGAAFELLPPQNATGNWIKIVQRLPVRIELNQKELRQHPLFIGLSMSATVDIHQQQGPRLADHIQPKSGYRTSVFKDSMRGAQSLINKIVAANIVNPPSTDDGLTPVRNAKERPQ
ncbi:efflux RND transporter periplasmic adaptor subunit [Nitrosococcus watsonii]|uniref:Secretion protein HlyD family protein n=1 Tax=Nitrosococcus watsoni (strain C-113) TaxID=105559 RepID=D8K891_NITWC|nr:efflux RND transporter periplasmic adaptor subunit [Nitrosococcus watsonii]ADJ27086.1 secretion protein HlyD family protein [Nitrosococcus watsonii C-113]